MLAGLRFLPAPSTKATRSDKAQHLHARRQNNGKECRQAETMRHEFPCRPSNNSK